MYMYVLLVVEWRETIGVSVSAWVSIAVSPERKERGGESDGVQYLVFGNAVEKVGRHVSQSVGAEVDVSGNRPVQSALHLARSSKRNNR